MTRWVTMTPLTPLYMRGRSGLGWKEAEQDWGEAGGGVGGLGWVEVGWGSFTDQGEEKKVR